MTLRVHPGRPAGRRQGDPYTPALLAASLLAHGAALALMLRAPHAAAAKPPAEIAVEVVKEMPAEAPKPEAAKAAPSAAQQPKRPERGEKAAAKAAAKPAAMRPTKTAAASPKTPAPRRAETPDAAATHDVAERMAQLLGPMPAAVVPTATTTDSPFDDGASYKQMVLSQVARQRREDRHNGIPGHVVVAFTVGDAGEVTRCEVKEKSVDPALDAEAVAMVYRGAPYPPPPTDAPRAFSFGLAFRPT